MKKRKILTMLALAALVLPVTVVNADAPRDIVYNMFNEVLKRNPTPEEFDRYMDLVIENGWDNSDLKRVLRQKKADAYEREVNGGSDYDRGYDRERDDRYDRGYSRDGDRDSRRYSGKDYYEKRRWVESAFEEKLGRLPTRTEMDDYCDICMEEKYDRDGLEKRVSYDFRSQPRSYSGNDDYRYDYDRYASDEEVEYVIEAIFREELDEDVDSASMRKYRRLMIDDGWSERRVRQDIADNPSLNRIKYEKIVVRAFEDLLNRRPKPRERDEYVDDMMRYRWDERRIRDKIKRSHEYSYERPRALIDQAYKEVLLRDPDPGAYGLTQQIVRSDWNLEDVKNHLRKSDEYRNQTIPKMLDMAYEELLFRKPDPYGIKFYSERAREGWTFEDIKDHIRASDEYADKH